MDFYEAVRARRSYRGYQDRAVPADAIARISEAVQFAPTACNRQPFRLLLISNPEIKRKICSIYTAAWLKQAPIIAVAVGNASEAWTRLEGTTIIDVDVAIMMEHFVLAAAAEGLGTCWICAYDRAALDSALGLEPGWKSVAISPLGCAEPGSCRPRHVKPVEEIVEVWE